MEAEPFYDEFAPQEWERLDRHRTEFAVTLKALAEFLPPPPSSILDIGGDLVAIPSSLQVGVIPLPCWMFPRKAFIWLRRKPGKPE
jgi:hypothetical protein